MTHLSAERMAWKAAVPTCWFAALSLLSLSVWLALHAVNVGFTTEGWAARLWAMAALSLAHLVLAFGATSRVYPISTLDRALSLVSLLIGVLTGVGAIALSLA